MPRFSNPHTEFAAGLEFASRINAEIAFSTWLSADIAPEPLSNAIITREDIEDIFPEDGVGYFHEVNWKRTISRRSPRGAVIYHYESDETDDDGIPVKDFWTWTMNKDMLMEDEYRYPRDAILISWRMRAITSYPASHPDWIGTGLPATDSANPNLTAPAGPPAEASTTQPPSNDECPAEPFPL